MAADQYTNEAPVAVVTVADVEIGAVEIKNATDDVRAVVQAASSAASATVGLSVSDGNLHDSLGAVGAATDVDGVLHGQLRYIGEAVDNLPAAVGLAASAASMPVVLASDDAHLGAVGAASDVDGHVHGQLRYIGEAVDALPTALGVTTSSASLPVVLASDDAHLGAVGAAADPDGVMHGQLRSIAENTDNLPAALGTAADAASLPVTMSTEDKAKVPALGVAASAASRPVVLASDDAHLGAVGAAADVDGVMHGQLRYIGEAVDNLPAAVGLAASAASMPVVLASDDAHLGAVGAASDVDGHVHGQLRYIGEAVDNIPSVGVAASTGALPVVLASDDAHLGAVGAAADPDGVMHGQLRSIAENTDNLPAALGPQLASASLSVVSALNEATVRTPITVAQTTPAAISTTIACSCGVRVYAPVANTSPVAVGYTGLTLANAVTWLYPGDVAMIPCTDAVHVFAGSAAASQALNWETI